MNKEIEPNPEDDLTAYAERIADDVTIAFNNWIRPELAKIIGWPAVNGIRDQEFESVLQAQYKMLHVEGTHTVRKDGATFYFKFLQGVPGKATLISKFKYEVKFNAYKEEQNDD